MGRDAIKLELIEWLTKLDDNETIQFLKVVKDSTSNEYDWWDDLTEHEKLGIERGVNDIKAGRVVSHDEVNKGEARLMLAAILFEKGKLTLGQAAEIVNLSKRAFMEIIGHYDISPINSSISDLEKDVNNARNYSI